MNDARDLVRLQKALAAIGVDDLEQTSVFATVAAIIHLGDITFDETGDAQGE